VRERVSAAKVLSTVSVGGIWGKKEKGWISRGLGLGPAEANGWEKNKIK